MNLEEQRIMTKEVIEAGGGSVVLFNQNEQRFRSPIVGSKYHAGAAAAMAHEPKQSTVRLVRQSKNPHDPNAVAVFDHAKRQQFGYIIRAVAMLLAPVMDRRGQSEMEADFLWHGGRPQVQITIVRVARP